MVMKLRRDTLIAVSAAKRILEAVETGEAIWVERKEITLLWRELGWDLDRGSYRAAEVDTLARGHTGPMVKFYVKGSHSYEKHFYLPFQVHTRT